MHACAPLPRSRAMHAALVTVACTVWSGRGGDARARGAQRLQPRVLTALEYVSLAWTEAMPVTIWCAAHL
jgi:hypothetical protein